MIEDAGSKPEIERTRLKARIDVLVAALALRATQGGWQVRRDHCFLRIAYDNATGDRWDRVHRRPAWRHLPIERLETAAVLLEQIAADGPTALGAFNAASLEHRRRTRGSLRP